MDVRVEEPFFARPARVVAQALLGLALVRRLDGVRLAGRIVETEAYCDAEALDRACHGAANQGRPTARTALMFGPPGHVYMYFTYGMHWMFNVVTGRSGQANAVLIRALAPLEGEEIIARRREGRPRREWTNGPAKLARALALDGHHNGACLFNPDGVVWIERAAPLPPEAIAAGPRIGLGKVPEPWLSMPWRYWIADDPFVSR